MLEGNIIVACIEDVVKLKDLFEELLGMLVWYVLIWGVQAIYQLPLHLHYEHESRQDSGQHILESDILSLKVIF